MAIKIKNTNKKKNKNMVLDKSLIIAENK